MLSGIQSYGAQAMQAVYNRLPNQDQFNRRLQNVALPAVALVVASQMGAVDAGPIAYASCMAGCVASGPFAPFCWAACLPILAAPTP